MVLLRGAVGAADYLGRYLDTYDDDAMDRPTD